MEPVKDYYNILGISENATKEDIKKRYYELAKKYHPDSSESEGFSEQKFIEINEAYHILIDPEKRETYDYVRKYGGINKRLWERFEKDVTNIKDFTLLLMEIQKYHFYKVASATAGSGIGIGTGAYIGYRVGGIWGAIVGGIIGGIAGMFGGSKIVDIVDGEKHKQLKYETTRKVLNYIENTPELKKPIAEFIYLKIFERQGIMLPIAYNNINRMAQIDERFNIFLQYFNSFGDFDSSLGNIIGSIIKGNVDEIGMILNWAKEYYDEINKENKIEKQISLRNEYIKLSQELQNLESSFFKNNKRIQEIKRKISVIEKEFKELFK